MDLEMSDATRRNLAKIARIKSAEDALEGYDFLRVSASALSEAPVLGARSRQFALSNGRRWNLALDTDEYPQEIRLECQCPLRTSYIGCETSWSSHDDLYNIEFPQLQPSDTEFLRDSVCAMGHT